MVQKSNTKLCNSSAHLVKGHNPYCSQWPTYSIKTKKQKLTLTGNCAFFVIFQWWLLTVQSWEMQFLTDSLISWQFFPRPLRPQNSKTFTDPTQFSQTFKALNIAEMLISFSPNFQWPSKSKTVQTLCKQVLKSVYDPCNHFPNIWDQDIKESEGRLTQGMVDRLVSSHQIGYDAMGRQEGALVRRIVQPPLACKCSPLLKNMWTQCTPCTCIILHCTHYHFCFFAFYNTQNLTAKCHTPKINSSASVSQYLCQ